MTRRSVVSVKKKAMITVPLILMSNVDQGNAVQPRSANQAWMRYRAFAPMIAPRLIKRYLVKAAYL